MIRNKRFFFVSIYIIFIIVLFEGSARVAFLIPQVAEKLWVEDDWSWRRRWMSKHSNAGKEIYIPRYKMDIYSSSLGWISQPNLRDMKVFHNKVLNTNSKGFRGKNEYTYGKDQEKVRILLLGDSFTFGDEVSDHETYAFYLQELLPQAEIINLGVHGYGHDQMLILLKEEGIKYNPDIIILGFLPMDMSRNLLNFRDYAKPKFVLDHEELRLTGVPVPPPEEIVKWDWARPRIVDLGSILYQRLMQTSGVNEKEKEDITRAILTEIIKLADSINAIPIFAYLPFGNEISIQPSLSRGEKYLFAMCQTNDKVRCFSTRPYFAHKITKGVIFKKHGHWEPAGHLAVAEAIKRYLIDEGSVPLRDNLKRYDINKPSKLLEPMR